MIQKVVIRRFKRFEEVSFTLPGNVVLAGPNNTGKTTVLQAIAAWGFALGKWRELDDYSKPHGSYRYVPVTRQDFLSVPLRTFDLLWHQRHYEREAPPMEVSIQDHTGWRFSMLFHADTTEQMYVRPGPDSDRQSLLKPPVNVVFVPPMTGLSREEPVYQSPYIDERLGLARPGEILRNLLVQAHRSETAWSALQRSIGLLFGYELVPPNVKGPYINAEFREKPGGPSYDIASGGSGFQQVLMLLTFLNTRPASVLLLDEPDAHLHVILQDAIYNELRSVAIQQLSQLIIATHSEVVINSVDPRELFAMMDVPQPIADTEQKSLLMQSLRTLSNMDIMLAKAAPGVLYLEGYTDLNILREWARILNHPVHQLLTTGLFWKPAVWEPREGAAGIGARTHYMTLRLVRNDIPGLTLIDGDGREHAPSDNITGHGLQTVTWRRYEIESYLLHPEALARFVTSIVGEPAAQQHITDLRKHFEDNYPKAFLENPFGDYPYLNNSKARTDLLPPALAAAGLPDIPYTEYYKIAALMKPDEIHPEVKEKLDAIQKAFNLA